MAGTDTYSAPLRAPQQQRRRWWRRRPRQCSLHALSDLNKQVVMAENVSSQSSDKLRGRRGAGKEGLHRITAIHCTCHPLRLARAAPCRGWAGRMLPSPRVQQICVWCSVKKGGR
ncbi:hypothetical protein E2C01_058886 [Portunus trituberculatus]|uniref:Uncharacterized protein n=1 Tax=Portunus trituberculatus TaxID=210409 RepID=A0A5B7H5E0_PORTR|nr:hypothetical protein [Portunus trituberculatus]